MEQNAQIITAEGPPQALKPSSINVSLSLIPQSTSATQTSATKKIDEPNQYLRQALTPVVVKVLGVLPPSTSERTTRVDQRRAQISPKTSSGDSTQAKSMQEEINLEGQKQEFNKLLMSLATLNNGLEDRKKTNKNYKTVAKAGEDLAKALTEARDEFFVDSPKRKLTYEKFKSKCTSALDAACREASNHRGWHALHPVIRAIAGIFALLIVIPALIVAKSSEHGFSGTFFKTPATNSSVALNSLYRQFKQIDEKIPTELKGATVLPPMA